MYDLVKRYFDLFFCLTGLTLLMPFLIPIMVILRFSGEGHVWYFQERIGYKNKKFDIWKFATMLQNSPSMGTGSITLRNDPRVTNVGKYLRMSKINELPQLFNVLRGEMSFVGPRPQMMVDFLAYPPHVQEKIYHSRPGITGIGSVVFRDEERLISEAGQDPKEFYKDQIAPYKGALELWYLQHKNLWVDFKLLVLTFWVLIFPKDIRLERWFSHLPPKPDSLKI